MDRGASAPGSPAGGGAPNRGTEGAPGRRGGCLLVLVATAGCFLLLRDFTETAIAALLAAVAAALLCGGGSLLLGSLRHVLESPWYAATCALGALMLVGGAVALAPGAPDTLLTIAPEGWEVLDRRLARLEDAVEAGDVGLAGKLAGRGLGDPDARDAWGNPVLHRARGAEMVAALLESGLDPDAADASGQTLLMRTSDAEVARALLAAGADPNARDERGFTPLMLQGDDPGMAAALLEAGADVHAENDLGRTVADLVRGPGRALLERYAGGRTLRETGGVTPRGRDEWRGPRPDGSGGRDASGVSLEGEALRPGVVGRVSILVDNASHEDRVVEVRAELDNAVLFVGASHGGAVQPAGRAGPTSAVRWPLLSLPADGAGRLEMQVLARPDDAVPGLWAGELSIDVFVVDLPQRTERVLKLRQARAGAPPRAGGAGAADGADASDPRTLLLLLLPAAAALLVWIAWRRRRGESASDRRFRIARTAAAGSALLCAAIAGTLLWSMAEPFVRFDEASCRILDRRILATEVEGGVSSRATGAGQRTRAFQGHPLAAVSIDTGDGPLVAAGWATGMATRSVHELRAFPVGRTAPCWLDPQEPRRFTLLRTPSLGGVVGLSMLAALVLALGLVAARLGRGSTGRQR